MKLRSLFTLFKWFDWIYIRSKYSYYRHSCAEFGSDVIFHGNVFIYREDNVRIGNRVDLNEWTIINAWSPITIGNNSVISAFSQLQTAGLILSNISSKEHVSSPIRIGESVWIWANSIILGGANIGNGSIIAANSVVKGIVPSGEVWGGIPAKKIREVS